jgi:hypothetical protein
MENTTMSLFRSLAASLRIVVFVGLWLGTLPAQATSIDSGDLLLFTGGCCGSSAVTTPNMVQVDSTGAFKGWSFSPFVPSDIAVDTSGNILFGSSSSGTIVVTNGSGGLVRLIPTPAPSINGLAVEANGNIVVASGNSFYELDPQGQFLSLIFSPVALGGCCSSNISLGIDSNGEAVFVAPSAGYGSTLSIDFFNLQTRVLRSVSTTFTSIAALDASEAGELVVVGSTDPNAYYDAILSIHHVGLDGTILSQFAGPQNVGALAVANLPEPGPALLVGIGLSLLALRRDRRFAR